MNIETLATLKHINVRKEGSDEKILAIDVRFNCQIPSDVLIEFHPTLRTMLWTQDGEPRFNRLIESINLIGQFSDHEIKVGGVEISDVTLRKWAVAALPMDVVDVDFVATFHPVSGQTLALLSEFVSEQVKLTVMSARDLFTKPLPAEKVAAPADRYRGGEWPWPETALEQPDTKADVAKPRKRSKKVEQEAPGP